MLKEVRIEQFESMTVVDKDSEAVVVIVKFAFPFILDRSWEQIEKGATEVVVSPEEAELTAADGTFVLVLPEQTDDDAMGLVLSSAEAEGTAANGTVVLVLAGQTDDDAMELELSAAEVEVTAGDGTVVLVLSEEIDEDAMELVVADGTVVLVPEVVVDVDSPLFDVALAGEALSTPLEKIRMQARTAMP